MSNSTIRRILVLGGLAIVGIIFIQSYLFYKTWNQKQQEFNQTINIALRKVATQIANYNGAKLPKQNLIQRRASNFYSVNINTAIDANVLEEYLTQTFNEYSINSDFEYGVYDCATDDMVYGSYCSMGDEDRKSSNTTLPKFDDLIYYFVVSFPNQEGYVMSTMKQTIWFSLIALLSVLFFIYAIYVILRQKQLTDLQKDFINNMTHEFKTPISSIKIASEFLARNSHIKDDSKMQQYTQIIRDQNERLNNQVEKVLNIARVEVDNFKLNKEEIKLNEFISKIVEQEKIQFEKLHGSLSFEPLSSEITVSADHLHFSNVISNMLDNARKYTSSTPKAKVSLRQNNKEINLSIKDNGIGINKEEQKKLFNKFYRVPTGNVHNVKGFGLGLFYVQNICASHGWTISVESDQDKGSCFTIQIPI